MTVQEPIVELQKENPNAQVVCGGNGPIYYLEAKPGYYDGHTPLLIEDERKRPYYSIIGYKWDPGHEKVVLQSMNFEDCIWNCMSIEKLDEFIVQGASRYLEGASETKERVKEVFKSWGKT